MYLTNQPIILTNQAVCGMPGPPRGRLDEVIIHTGRHAQTPGPDAQAPVVQ